MIVMTSNHSGGSSSTWLIDFSTSHHLTQSEEKVPNTSPYDSDEGIVVGNDNALSISSIGSSFLHTHDNASPSINHFFHTPYASINLLSVQKLCIDNNVFVEFHFGLFYVKDHNSKLIILQGSSHNGLYKITSVVQGFSSSNDNDIQTYYMWHRKLGHPSIGTIIKMLKSYGVVLSSINKASVFLSSFLIDKGS